MSDFAEDERTLRVIIKEVSVELFLVNVSSDTSRVIVTTAIGGDYFSNWRRNSYSSWRKYAVDNDLGIVVILSRLITGPESEAKNASWDKLLAPQAIGSVFPSIQHICFMDPDIVISSLAPNVFDLSSEGRYCVVSQERNLPFPIKEVRKRVALLRRHFYDPEYPLDSILQASAEDTFRLQGLPTHSDYFCAGLIMLDRSLFDDLAECHSSVSIGGALSAVSWEEPFVNDWIQSRPHSWMPYEYQAIWLFEVAWFYPHLYRFRESLADNEEASETISSVLLNRHFLHFAGSWFESDAWVNAYSKASVANSRLLDDISMFNPNEATAKSLGKILPPRNL